jgi:peptide subunit release factor 1 (eRF1)
MLPVENDILQIERFRHPEGGRALSLYLETNSARGPGRNLRAQLEDVLRPVRASLEGDDREARSLEADVEAVMSQLDALEPRPRAIAAFACRELGFVRIVPIPERIEPMARWEPTFHLGPLRAALDERERIVVVLVDKEHGSVYRTFMGQIEEVAHLSQEPEGHAQAGYAQQKRTGGSNGVSIRAGYGERNLQRRHEWHIRKHLDRVLTAMRGDGSWPTDRILIGGATETVHELLYLLPKRIRDRTRLISKVTPESSPSIVLARVADAQRDAEREAEEELLDNLTERDRDRSVFGAVAVSEAVADGRVHTLVYGSDAIIRGAECARCGWLAAGPLDATCPRCQAEMTALPDLVERMVSRVLRSGGRVEEVREFTLRTLNRLGGVAALLRYVPPSSGTPPTRPRPSSPRT